MSSEKAKKRGNWTQDNLNKALEAIRKKEISDYKAAKEFGIPRRTLRRYLKSNSNQKAKLGRKFALTEKQNAELCSRIVRLAEVGYPITTKILRLCVYKYCKENNIEHQFSDVKQIASHKWVRKFLKENPTVSIRKSQNLNPARAQKLNRYIVEDHFRKLQTVFEDNEIFGKPEKLFNMDEKGCRLNLHKEPKVLAKKGARRVHIIGNEHGENVTVVSCANAMGASIPPMILFKGKRMKAEFADDLPPGSVCRMTEKGSMTAKCFVDWLHHFGHYKPTGRCVLIFDGAKSHLDYDIVATADQYDVVLYCLPSNTTHELQPLDKAVFRSFEHHWDQQVMLYWHNNGERTLTKQRFAKIFTPVWDLCMTPSNIKSGFRATGLYPYDPNAIPEEAFKPSIASELPVPEQAEPLATSTPTTTSKLRTTSPQPGPSGLSTFKHTRAHVLSTDEVDSVEAALIGDDEDDDTNANLSEDEEEDAGSQSFQDLLPTPIKKTRKVTNRRKAINSRAVVLKRTLFDKKETVDEAPKSKCSKTAKGKSKKIQKNESWFCHVCKEDAVKDMRICSACKFYVHEECVGLTKEDNELFICPDCEN
ncbi:unnamed protein product [Tenebrio molitor]|nr:unnamed protein product [Tenebrio molitor]